MEKFLAFLILCCLGVGFFSGMAHWEISAYKKQSQATAERAGWEWKGCDVAYMGPMPTRATCLVKDADGKIVDIDNIRSD